MGPITQPQPASTNTHIQRECVNKTKQPASPAQKQTKAAAQQLGREQEHRNSSSPAGNEQHLNTTSGEREKELSLTCAVHLSCCWPTSTWLQFSSLISSVSDDLQLSLETISFVHTHFLQCRTYEHISNVCSCARQKNQRQKLQLIESTWFPVVVSFIISPVFVTRAVIATFVDRKFCWKKTWTIGIKELIVSQLFKGHLIRSDETCSKQVALRKKIYQNFKIHLESIIEYLSLRTVSPLQTY